jgi:WhiB family redox-sensing transcriptional regulator
VARDESWKLVAACRGLVTGDFFPDSGDSTKEQKAVCARCPVREVCLEYALFNRIEHGIWGGASERERKRIRRKRREDARRGRLSVA